MADFGVGDITGIVGGTAGVGVLAKYVWDSVKGRKDDLEAKAETSVEKKIDQLLLDVAEIKSENRVTAERQLVTTAVVTEVKERIDGVSTNHGKRIGDLELWRASLEGKRRR